MDLTTNNIIDWHLTPDYWKFHRKVTIEIHPDEIGFVKVNYSTQVVSPNFIEITPYQLTDKAAEYIGRPVIYGRDVREAMDITAIFTWLIHASEEMIGEE